MGKVSLFLIAFGIVAIVPAIILTIISLVFPAFIINQSNWFSILKVFVIGLLYAVAFGFIVLGLIVMKRDKE
jgi:hypothetical protein